MQIVSLWENLPGMSKPKFWENKKKNLKYCLLKFLPRMLSIISQIDLSLWLFHFDIIYKHTFTFTGQTGITCEGEQIAN